MIPDKSHAHDHSCSLRELWDGEVNEKMVSFLVLSSGSCTHPSGHASQRVWTRKEKISCYPHNVFGISWTFSDVKYCHSWLSAQVSLNHFVIASKRSNSNYYIV